MTVWDALIGQPEAAKELRAAAESGGGSHAWLITGPPGSGRSIAAKCFAAALQCTGAEPGCGVCEGCRTTMAGSNLDVTALATDKVIISSDQVHELRDASYVAPVLGPKRVIIVEDADRIQDTTGNVLLKAIEEPPDRTVWILCAPTPEDLLVTIRSRCRQLRLVAPPAEDVAELLVQEMGVPYEEALAAARISQSHVGLARAMIRDPLNRDRRVDLMRIALQPSSTGDAVLAAAEVMQHAKTLAEKTSADLDGQEIAALLAAYGLSEDQVLPRSVSAEMRALKDNQKRRSRRALADALDRVCLDLLSFLRDCVIRASGACVPAVNVDMEQELSWWQGRDQAGAVRSVEVARERLRTNAAQLLVMEAMIIGINRPT